MLTKDIVRYIKAAKGQAKFLDSLNKNWSVSTKPSEFKSVVTQAIIDACPELMQELVINPITNGTANSVASKLDRS